MNSKEFFVKYLIETFSEEEFIFIKSKNALRKKKNDFTYLITFTSMHGFAHVSFSYSLLINEVEKEKKKAWGKSYNRFETAGINKPYLSKDADDAFSYTDTEKLVVDTINNEYKFYTEVASEYFANHLSYEYIDVNYNSLTCKRIPFIAHFNQLHSAVFAIYSASKNNNPNLQLLIRRYRSFLEKNQPSLIEYYDKFIKLIPRSA